MYTEKRNTVFVDTVHSVPSRGVFTRSLGLNIGKVCCMGQKEKVELLAPAGNAEGFYGAIHAGADAVYLAGEQFGARAYAENFTREKLLECIRYAHLLDRRIYLAVNTLVKDSELPQLADYLRPFYEAGLDAVIVQDMGVFGLIREHFPGLKIHVSTQVTIASGYGALLLKRMGASRIVPARELGLQEICSMKKQADIEIETFIHGAMCYCYSGQCLFSSILGGRSGNRGRCAQPCRLPYSVQAGSALEKECYPLSLKDMCTVSLLPQLVEAGIDSFKIEGRMKRPEYAAGVTAVYRRYIDTYYELREKRGSESAAGAYQVSTEDMSLLSSLYSRSGISKGYYFRRNGRDMITMENPAYNGSDPDTLTEIREKYIVSKKKIPVDIKALFRVGQPAEVCFSCREDSFRAAGDAVECARNQPVTPETIKKQLGKLGESVFAVSNMDVEADPDCFYPLKAINELRRAAADGLAERILARKNAEEPDLTGQDIVSPGNFSPSWNTAFSFDYAAASGQKASHVCYALHTTTLPQLEAAADWLWKNRPEAEFRLYIEGDLYLQSKKKVTAICGELSEFGTFFAVLPYIVRLSDEEYLENLYRAVTESGLFRGFLVRSMDGLGFLQERGCELSCRLDAGIYIWNQEAGKELSAFAEGYCLPYELRRGEQKPLAGNKAWEKVVYGRIPMMVTANCLYRTLGQCGKGKNTPLSPAVLKDRYDKAFPVAVNCLHCMNVIYNSVPLSLHRELSFWRGTADLRLNFTLESPGEVRAILDCFLKGAPYPQTEYTTGHEKRGVE